jgi:predicted O-methyltransferase YrrM
MAGWHAVPLLLALLLPAAAGCADGPRLPHAPGRPAPAESLCAPNAPYVGWNRIIDQERDRRPVTQALKEALALREGLRVVDFGAGVGYFTRVMQDAVGPTGEVVAVDEDEMCARRLEAYRDATGAKNVTVYRELEELLASGRKFDRLLMIGTGAFLEGQEQRSRDQFQALLPVLAEGGRVVLAENLLVSGQPVRVGDPPAPKLPPERVAPLVADWYRAVDTKRASARPGDEAYVLTLEPRAE